MPVNLQAQDVWDSIEYGEDVEEHKDRMTLVVIYQVVSEDVLLMGREGLGKSNMGGASYNACGCGMC